MPRFVILHHCLLPGGDRQTHWDLMIECEGELLTWALDESPKLNSRVSAIELANHRLDYLQYEGPVSGGRGEVRRVESGLCTILYRDGRQMLAELQGETLRCSVEISREASVGNDAPNRSRTTSAASAGNQRCTVSFMPVSNPPN